MTFEETIDYFEKLISKSFFSYANIFIGPPRNFFFIKNEKGELIDKKYTQYINGEIVEEASYIKNDPSAHNIEKWMEINALKILEDWKETGCSNMILRMPFSIREYTFNEALGWHECSYIRVAFI